VRPHDFADSDWSREGRGHRRLDGPGDPRGQAVSCAGEEPAPPRQTSRPPRGFRAGETNRLFVASGGFWRGFFVLDDDVLYTPEDDAPFSFVFDTRTWTPFAPVPAIRFRGISLERFSIVSQPLGPYT